MQSCRTPYFLILDAHMRFYQDNWHRRIIEELTANDRQLLCSQTRVLLKKDGTITGASAATNGAYIYMGARELMPVAKWNVNKGNKSLKSGQIACVLGAGYAASKTYWNELKGLQGLLGFGCEEPYLSLKAWKEGGGCRLLVDVPIGHIYKDYSSYSCISGKFVFNHLFIAETLLPMSLRCKAHSVARNKYPDFYQTAILFLDAVQDETKELRAYYRFFTGNTFEQISQMNNVLPSSDIEQLKESLEGSQWKRLLSFCETSAMMLQTDGLYDGRMGGLIFFCLCYRYTGNKDYDHRASVLFTDLCENIKADTQPSTFKNGFLGVGWGLIYLADNGFVNPEVIRGEIAKIDDLTSRLAPTRFSDFSMEYGFPGLIAYCTARLGFQKRHGGAMPFCADFIEELKNTAKKNLEQEAVKANVLAQALLMLMARYGEDDWNTLPADFNDIMEPQTYLPKEDRYWTFGLKGCVGYAVYILTTILKAR